MIKHKIKGALALAMLLGATAYAQTSNGQLADLSQVPQLHETTEQRDARMQWFRDAKFGMFIHWGPCSVGQAEIGWGRRANRPWDINQHGPRTSDPVYDNYYKQFNPVKYDADAWVRFAKESGMKYMVLITKHHDGFSQFNTKLSDYSIMHSPYGKDIVKQFVEACHKHGIKAGLYYSTRDWYHRDYLVGNNAKYDAFYRGQVQELLTNYGKVDMMWFDHVGGRDWGKWRFDQLFAMMYRLQPGLLVDDRAARFCGPKSPEDRGPATPEIQKMTQGDFSTPEGHIGSMNLTRDWESCIHVGKGWSYHGEDGFKGPEDCITMLVSCITGGGNLLLNFGPRPDGTFAEGEAKVARAMGAWLKKYREAIYGTRGGPIRNGSWGGSCHKGNRLFLHVFQWPNGPLAFDPLPFKVESARTLTGAKVQLTQTAKEFTVSVAESDRDTPVTVIELTLDKDVPDGKVLGGSREAHGGDKR
jgi:alpha-L-fucosidase